jgi:hypothetical protein
MEDNVALSLWPSHGPSYLSNWEGIWHLGEGFTLSN